MRLHKIYMIRHGESEWNKLNLFCGWNDVNLSDKGKEEAVNISAETLRKEGIKFDVAFTSMLKRANQTLDTVLNSLGCNNIPIHYAWQLNERHYGALTGFNKRQTAEVYGEAQVQIWRRSFNILPPPITPQNPYYESIQCNPRFMSIPENDFPNAESLETTMQRVVPYWEREIIPEIRKGSNVLIVAHGTSLRGLVKHIENLPEERIMKFNLPNSIPFYYTFDENMKRVGDIQFLGDKESVLRAMSKVAAIGN